MNDFVLKLLALVAEHDDHHSLFWRCDEKYAPISFFVNCNDLFFWATADCEQVTPENLPVLEKAYQDARAVDHEYMGGELFACRMRKMRPQRAAYRDFAKELWPLYDACGPERDPKTEG